MCIITPTLALYLQNKNIHFITRFSKSTQVTTHTFVTFNIYTSQKASRSYFFFFLFFILQLASTDRRRIARKIRSACLCIYIYIYIYTRCTAEKGKPRRACMRCNRCGSNGRMMSRGRAIRSFFAIATRLYLALSQRECVHFRAIKSPRLQLSADKPSMHTRVRSVFSPLAYNILCRGINGSSVLQGDPRRGFPENGCMCVYGFAD